MRDTVFLPIGLIRTANNEGWLRSLAYFVRMKALYKNNTHYNFSLRSLSQRLKCSPACLATHLKKLEAEGLARRHAKNITFTGLKKLLLKFGKSVIGVPVHKRQLTYVQAQVIRLNLDNQDHMMRKHEVQKRRSGYVPTRQLESFYSTYIGLSVFGFGKALGLSPSSGQRLRRKMVREGILAQTRRFSKIAQGIDPGTVRRLKISGDVPHYAFLKNGILLQERRSQLEYIHKTPPLGTSVVTRN